MQIDARLAEQIVQVAHGYLGQSREDWDCVSFVRLVLKEVGVEFPPISRALPPPIDFQILNPENLTTGHSIFFRRILTTSNRLWTHCGIVMPENSLIHYPIRQARVTITPFPEVLERYEIVRLHPA